MSYESKLKAEINTSLVQLHANQRDIIPQFVASQIVHDHKRGLPAGENGDFWLHCGYSKTREMVTRCINRCFGGSRSNNGKSAALPGFDHLQSYYVVRRNGLEIGLPIDRLTESELAAKAKQHRSNGLTNLAHASELERYVSIRDQSEAA